MTILQAFDWNLPVNHALWNRLKSSSGSLKKLGFDAVWLPPAYKNSATNGVGYGPYDLYDLGEFDQKGSVPTKYGTKAEYLAAISELQKSGLQVLADIVLNHRLGADEPESVVATPVDSEDRLRPLGEPREISAWTKFNFPGRGDKYSDFKWDKSCFTSVSYDGNTNEEGVFLFSGKKFASKVAHEKNNFDYLMGADIDLNNLAVREELLNWGKWYVKTTGIDGFRFDALKHIGSDFLAWWLTELRHISPLFAIGEYWSGDVRELEYYLDKVGNQLSLFDAPLHFNFYSASHSMSDYDLGGIFNGSLLNSRPDRAITFVDNHDTEPRESLNSWVDGWFKNHAYAIILLRGLGTPCVFYGDLYGIPSIDINPVPALPLMLKLRERYAYGKLRDYFDDRHVVGFTRAGDDKHPHSGLAVVLNNSDASAKHMTLGPVHKNQTMVEVLHGADPMSAFPRTVTLDEHGSAIFPVPAGNVSIWTTPDAAKTLFISLRS